MSIYNFQVNTIDGKLVRLSAYQGQVLLIVNTASKCSYSRQFADLQNLYEIYSEQGLEILGFPCNQFNDKEPGSNADVEQFCKSTFGVTFPMSEKIEVRGRNAHPLFQYLTQQAPFQGFDTQTSNGQWMLNFLQDKHPEIYAGDGIKWNFSKFLIDRKRHVRARFETTTEVMDIEPAIKSLIWHEANFVRKSPSCERTRPALNVKRVLNRAAKRCGSERTRLSSPPTLLHPLACSRTRVKRVRSAFAKSKAEWTVALLHPT